MRPPPARLRPPHRAALLAVLVVVLAPAAPAWASARLEPSNVPAGAEASLTLAVDAGGPGRRAQQITVQVPAAFGLRGCRQTEEWRCRTTTPSGAGLAAVVFERTGGLGVLGTDRVTFDVRAADAPASYRFPTAVERQDGTTERWAESSGSRAAPVVTVDPAPAAPTEQPPPGGTAQPSPSPTPGQAPGQQEPGPQGPGQDGGPGQQPDPGSAGGAGEPGPGGQDGDAPPAPRRATGPAAGGFRAAEDVQPAPAPDPLVAPPLVEEPTVLAPLPELQETAPLGRPSPATATAEPATDTAAPTLAVGGDGADPRGPQAVAGGLVAAVAAGVAWAIRRRIAELPTPG